MADRRRHPATYVVGLDRRRHRRVAEPGAARARGATRSACDYVYRLLDIDELGRPPTRSARCVREARETGSRASTSRTRASSSWSPELDELSRRRGGARRRQHGRASTAAGAVGHNTDTTGLRARRSSAGCPARALDRVVLLGAGGAGAAVGARDAGARRAAADGRRRRRASARARARARSARRPRAAPTTLAARSAARRRLVHATPDGHGRAPRARRSPPDAAAAASCGWPTSSTGRSRPSCCATPAQRGCRTLDGGGMVGLPGGGRVRAVHRRCVPTASGCSRHFDRADRRCRRAREARRVDRDRLPERHARGQARRRRGAPASTASRCSSPT